MLDGLETPTYSLVIPIFNEEESVPELLLRLRAVMDGLDGSAEVVHGVQDLGTGARGADGFVQERTRLLGHPERAVAQARGEVFQGELPASTLIVVKSLAQPELLIEVEGMAAIG